MTTEGRMKVYISGRMAGLPADRVQKHFAEAQEYLTREGFIVMNPDCLRMCPGFDYDDYMSIDIAMLQRCDAIYMLVGWEESNGAKKELKFAIENNKRVFLEGFNAI